MKNTELGEMVQKIRNIEKILLGNGTKGLLKKMEELTTEIIPDIKITLERLRNYSHLKNWILGGVVAILLSVCAFLATQLYYIKFG